MTSFSGNLLSHVLARAIFQVSERNDLCAFVTPVYCPDINGVRADTVTTFKPNSPTYGSDYTLDASTIKIDIDQEFEQSYTIPYEQLLKSEFDLVDICKKFFVGQFTQVVNDYLMGYINANDTTLDAGADYAYADVPALFANAATYYQINQIGDKDRIYKYSNGAPVVYTNSVNKFDFNIPFDKPDGESLYQAYLDYRAYSYPDINSNQSGFYYPDRPTVVFGTQADLQAAYLAIADKTVDRTFATSFEIAYCENELGGVIVGKNDNFALCYTSPRIEIVKDTNGFNDIVKCAIYYGIKPINNPVILKKTIAEETYTLQVVNSSGAVTQVQFATVNEATPEVISQFTFESEIINVTVTLGQTNKAIVNCSSAGVSEQEITLDGEPLAITGTGLYDYSVYFSSAYTIDCKFTTKA